MLEHLSKDFEVEFLVELGFVLFEGGGKHFGGSIHHDTWIAPTCSRGPCAPGRPVTPPRESATWPGTPGSGSRTPAMRPTHARQATAPLGWTPPLRCESSVAAGSQARRTVCGSPDGSSSRPVSRRAPSSISAAPVERRLLCASYRKRLSSIQKKGRDALRDRARHSVLAKRTSGMDLSSPFPRQKVPPPLPAPRVGLPTGHNFF